MIEITPNLYLGNLSTIEDYQQHNLDKFSLIINISNIPIHSEIIQKLQKTKIVDIKIPDVPQSNIRSYFDSTSKNIHECLSQQQKVLVYCKVGKSRSVSIIINYLMTYQDISYELAFVQMLTKKSSIGPNYGFIQQLKEHRYQSHSSFENIISHDLQQLHELHQQKIKRLEGKKTSEEWEELSKDREIERYLDSVLGESKKIYSPVSCSNNKQN